MVAKKKIPKEFPPNKSLEVFKPIIGAWDTVGSHPLIPDIELHGRTSFNWHESGAFIIMRSSINEHVGVPDGVAVIAGDDTLKSYTLSYYDERGVARLYQVTVKGSVLTWWRDAAELSQRYTLTVSKDHQTMVGKGAMSKDGRTWDKDLSLTYTRLI